MYKSMNQLLTISLLLTLSFQVSAQDAVAMNVPNISDCALSYEGEIFKHVEVMPSLYECSDKENAQKCTNKALKDLMKVNQGLTENLKSSESKSSTMISFVVEADGCLTSFNVRRDGCNGCGNMITHILRNETKWNAGSTQGKKVRVMKSFLLNHLEK